MNVGLEIRRRREAKGWSQAKVAGLAGMGVSGVSQIETGVRNPSAVTLQKLAQALQVDVADLFPKGQAPLPLEENQGQRGDPFLKALTSYVLRFAEEWENARIEPEELHAKPQLAYEVLSRNEVVQRECYMLMEIISAAIKDAYTPPKWSSERLARWRAEGTTMSPYGLLAKQYEERADIQRLVETMIRIDRLTDLWDISALHARDCIRDVTELRPEPDREEEKFERGAEARRNTASIVMDLYSSVA